MVEAEILRLNKNAPRKDLIPRRDSPRGLLRPCKASLCANSEDSPLMEALVSLDKDLSFWLEGLPKKNSFRLELRVRGEIEEMSSSTG